MRRPQHTPAHSRSPHTDQANATRQEIIGGSRIKQFRGITVRDFSELEGDTVKVNWSDDTVDEIPLRAWTELNRAPRKNKRALKKIMAPMSDEATVLEVRAGRVDESTEDLLADVPDAISDRMDYRVLAAEPDEIEERLNVFDAEAELLSVDFRPGQKWRVGTPHGERSVEIEDMDFLRSLDHGLALHKGDLLDVTIRETVTVKNGRTTTEWVVTHAALKRRRGDTGDDAAQ